MKIGFDYDDVLFEHVPAIIKFHNHTYNTKLTIDDFISYDFWKVWGGTREQAINKMFEHYNSKFFEQAQVVENSQRIITQLSKHHNLEIITARQNEIKEQTYNSIHKFFPNKFDEIHMVNSYSKDNSKPLSKRDVCDKIGIDLLVEDSLTHALACVTPNRDIVLIDKPWNQTSDKLPSGIHRVKHLNDYFKIF
ncbi:MAG: hypothetical protein HRU03_01755 [Nanoarchaeales archaeon]|nr:hypothetical protein [Nanoarchaeales archaeon]